MPLKTKELKNDLLWLDLGNYLSSEQGGFGSAPFMECATQREAFRLEPGRLVPFSSTGGEAGKRRGRGREWERERDAIATIHFP